MDSVARYSYFGSFRSGVSNVGPDAAMLNDDGELTDIGSWYLGGSATGVDPQSPGVRIRGSAVTVMVSALLSSVVILW